MENLKKLIVKDIENKYNKVFDEIKTQEGLNKWLKWENKQYKKDELIKFSRYLLNKREKEIKKQFDLIQEAEQSQPLANDFIITIEWKRSYMWGSNPTALTNYGFVSRSIGGCGYDKQSTATAEALNSHPFFLKLMYEKKNAEIEQYLKENPDRNEFNDFNRSVLGYGSGYNILPKFEGGVGVDCHKRILEGLGYEMKHVSNTKTTDVYIISKRVV